MKLKIPAALVVTGILIIWGIRFYSVNGGRMMPYTPNEVLIYPMGEAVSLQESNSYGGAVYDQCTITVHQARVIDFDEFCAQYQKTAEQFQFPYDRMIELEVTLINQSAKDTEIYFDGFILRGTDWWCSAAEDATAFANLIPVSEQSGLSISGVTAASGTETAIKLVYGMQKTKLPSERWNAFEKENLELVITLHPTEQRVQIIPAR